MQANRVHLFRAAAPARPFGDDAQGSTKPGSLETSPQFSAIVTAGGPLRVEPWKMRLE